MQNIVRFYTYGRARAPRGWNIVTYPYVNRIYYIYGGNGYFLSGAGEYRLKPGHLYVFPYRLKFLVRQDEEDPVDHMYFDFTLVPPFTGSELVEIPVAGDSMLGHTVAALTALYAEPDYRRDDALQPLIRHYFESILTLACREKRLHRMSDPRLTAALEHLHAHYGEPVTVRTLAGMANMELNHFIRTFKRELTVTPHQYLREYRLNVAAHLLEGGMPVNRVAREVGYENTSSFSGAFRKHRGAYPTQWTARRE